MKYILGLDIGTNSIGWCLLNNNNVITDRGIVIFPIGTNVDKNGIEKTKNQQRREYRSTKRRLFRYKLRRKRLLKVLSTMGVLPRYDEQGNLIKTYRVKEEYQGFYLYEQRTLALSQAISLEELGRIFLLMNKYRGFKSGSKTILEERTDKEEGKVIDGIKQLASFIHESNSRTIGEYFYKMFLKARELYNAGKWHNPEEPYDERAIDAEGKFKIYNNRGIRREYGRFTDRRMYEKEFDLIWTTQKKYYPEILTGSLEEYHELKEQIKNLPREEKRKALLEFKQTNYWKIKHECIFYQRPLKSPKKYIGKCIHESNKRTTSVSSFLFQEFRIWKQLADIRFSDIITDADSLPLPEEWREKIFQYLQTHPKLPLRTKKGKGGKPTDLFDLLDLNPKQYVFNFDNDADDKYFIGNITKSTLYKALGEKCYEEVNAVGKLERLWHLVYMKKDNEWLLNTLNDKAEWPELSGEGVNNLCEISFEDGYGAYSSKVLKKLVPHMREGKSEYDSLVLAGYQQAPDEVKEDWKPRDQITQLRNGELRNPVVEKAVTEVIKLVNSIISEHQIDKENWTIRIESTRELKKPKAEREKMRRQNTEKDKLREEYVKFLNSKRKEGLLPLLSRDVNKYDSIINKFELWLEMGGDKDDPAFQDFEKAIKEKDHLKKLKYKLWLECGRLCPYSGKVINLTTLFSPGIEIEHIVPLSRSLDNSFANKTLTFREINTEKKNKTAWEFMKEKSEMEFKHFQRRISIFNKAKKENFEKSNVLLAFTHAQISNTSYIAKYVRRKLQEVCKEVYFTNGMVTAELRNNDWRLSDLIDMIRYEEETGVNMDVILNNYKQVRKDFNKYRKEAGKEEVWSKADWQKVSDEEFEAYKLKTNNHLKDLLAEAEKYEEFRGKKGKKDRSDHRHHALDAIITACCAPAITHKLSAINAQREIQGIDLFDEKGNLAREHIPCPLSREAIKESLKDILVVNKVPQRLMVRKKNKTKKVKDKKGIRFNERNTFSIRASLHKDTFYGKLKNPKHQEIDKPMAYVSRSESHVYEFTDESSLNNIYDKDLKEIIRRRISWFKERNIAINKETYEQYPLFRYSPSKYPQEPENPVSKDGKPLPVVKKVRTLFKNYRSIIEIPVKRRIDVSKEEEILSMSPRYADADGNYIMALYELKEKDKKGKIKVTRDFIIRSSYEAVSLKNRGEKLFPDEKEKNGKILPLMSECPYLKQGDLVVMYQDEEDKKSINWNDQNDLKKRLFIVKGLGTDEGYGIVSLLKHSKSSVNRSYRKSAFELNKNQIDFSNRHTQFNAVKVRMNNLGRIVFENTTFPRIKGIPLNLNSVSEKVE